MQIALVGSTGNIGRQIARHALARGHELTVIVRSAQDLPAELAGAHPVVASLDDLDALVAAIAGHDVLASAYGPRPGDDIGRVGEVAAQLAAAARKAGVPRLVVVGGAGSLAFNRLQAVDDLDWTFFSPAAEIGPGEERGQYRVQPKAFLADASGHSRISYADYGAAFVAELEAHAYPKQIITAAY